MFERRKLEKPWEGKLEPFRIIGNHTWNNDTANKGELLLETGENRFIHPQLWHRFLTCCEERLDRTIGKDV